MKKHKRLCKDHLFSEVYSHVSDNLDPSINKPKCGHALFNALWQRLFDELELQITRELGRNYEEND